jgi:hypothetical protein
MRDNENRVFTNASIGSLLGAIVFMAYFSLPLGMGSNLPGMMMFSLIGAAVGFLLSETEWIGKR